MKPFSWLDLEVKGTELGWGDKGRELQVPDDRVSGFH